jgi:hypothetical protein
MSRRVRLRLWTTATKGLLLSPGWDMNMENHGEMMPAGENWLVHQSSLAILPAESSGRNMMNGRKEWEFSLVRISFTPASDFLHAMNGISGFTSHPKEVVLRISVALKNLSPRPGLNPWRLGPVAETLTTTPVTVWQLLSSARLKAKQLLS